MMYYPLSPVALCLYDGFDNNAVYVPSNVNDRTKCGIKAMKSKRFSKVKCFPHAGSYFGGRAKKIPPHFNRFICVFVPSIAAENADYLLEECLDVQIHTK